MLNFHSSFTALLEFATEKTAIIVGKPSKDFFQAALNDMNIDADLAIMVGDDIGRLWVGTNLIFHYIYVNCSIFFSLPSF